MRAKYARVTHIADTRGSGSHAEAPHSSSTLLITHTAPASEQINSPWTMHTRMSDLLVDVLCRRGHMVNSRGDANSNGFENQCPMNGRDLLKYLGHQCYCKL